MRAVVEFVPTCGCRAGDTNATRSARNDDFVCRRHSPMSGRWATYVIVDPFVIDFSIGSVGLK